MGDGHPIDGELAAWEDVQKVLSWDTLLLGNGLSINVWPNFGYGSLYDQAARGTRFGGFSNEDKKLFAALGTENFERVLADLNAAIRVAKACGKNPYPFYQRYRSIQRALAAAVRSVHIDRVEVPEHSLHAIRECLREYEWVFTTSYDLILYWAMGFGDTFRGFCDCFWSNGRNEFDPARTKIYVGITPVFFAHGALHLLAEGDGTTRKLTRDSKTLLDQFGQPIPGDPEARPLLVTEGSSHDKVVAIEDNVYLSYVLQMLRARQHPLVVFGHNLGAQDQHLVDAINVHPDRPVAVSIRAEHVKKVRARQGEIRAKLDTEELYFFDAASHPLGASNLTKRSTLWRPHTRAA